MIGGMGRHMPGAFLLVRSCIVPERLMQFIGIYGAMQLRSARASREAVGAAQARRRGDCRPSHGALPWRIAVASMACKLPRRIAFPETLLRPGAGKVSRSGLRALDMPGRSHDPRAVT
ncbi:hypothetical protein D8B34_27435, partial [Verminephrobacter eiseniae]|nr:hypothetical protein [Verminephrobacter eiseniae]